MLKVLEIDLVSITTIETRRDCGDWILVDFYGPTEVLVEAEMKKYKSTHKLDGTEMSLGPKFFKDGEEDNKAVGHWYGRIKRRAK